MQKYLVLFIAILLLCTWIVDQYLITTVQANMLEQTRDGLEQVASPLIKKLTDAPVLDDLEELEKLLDSHDKSPTIQYDIINSVGQILATTDPLIKMETSNNQSEKPEVINARNNVTFTVSGEKSFWTQKIDVGDQLGFFVRTSQNNTVISETTSTIRRSIWLMSLVVGLVGATLFILFSRTSLQPLYDFTNVARQIATGKYDAALSLQGREENWVMLSEAFRHMQDELEKREVNILDNNARLQAVLSSMIEGVLAINSSGQVMLANGAACEMLQLSHADVQGRQFIEIFRIPELTAAIETTQKDRSFSKCEFQTRELPRKIISARVSVLSETAERKRPGIAVVLHDVTDLRTLENMRRDFVANVSHELKTPLASIKAYAETLKLGAINDHEKNLYFVENIEAQADLLNEQIQDLLQLARVESGQKNWDIDSVSIDSICHSLIRQFSSEADARNINVQLLPCEETLYAKADRDGVRTILSNLISNALHYTPEGGSIDVHISDQNQFIKIEVVDDGIGIAPDHHARIFERFYRVDKARSREYGGTGLGLAIVKHLCQAFGGSVALESTLGDGSRFIVKLPNAQRGQA